MVKVVLVTTIYIHFYENINLKETKIES